MPVSTITSKGQTTIPGEIRRHLKLKAGDRIEFVVEADGRVVLVPATVNVRELKGLLAPAPRRVSLEEMESAIRKHALATYISGF
ncbi:MAG: type II toxin-antitoxin system PrlF family antitoxin [Candidatus Binataceae bacterium]|jgi:AbrB family looped-hinge helix DNA binding protein